LSDERSFPAQTILPPQKKTRHILTNGDKELWAGDRFIAGVDILGQDVLVDHRAPAARQRSIVAATDDVPVPAARWRPSGLILTGRGGDRAGSPLYDRCKINSAKMASYSMFIQ
jgi:hypothetical protein